MNVCRPTAGKWWGRYLDDPRGQWWLDREPAAPLPPSDIGAGRSQVREAADETQLGPARSSGQVGVPASTVHRIRVRHRLNRLAWMDRPTGLVIRRYEHDHPGDLVHRDIKKLGKVPSGGGWRTRGRNSDPGRPSKRRPRIGYSQIHTAIDDHSRVAYSEVLDDEQAVTTVGFWRRARVWFVRHGIDHRPCSPTRLLLPLPAVPSRAGRLGHHIDAPAPTDPKPTAKSVSIERFNRTLCDEWAYVRPYRSENHDVGDSTPGSTPTTITAPTPPSAANHHPRQQPPKALHTWAKPRSGCAEQLTCARPFRCLRSW